MALRKALRLPTIVSTSAGLAFAAINFLAAVQLSAVVAGASAPLALLTAGALSLLAGTVFSRLNDMHPSAAGIRLWTRLGLGDGFSLGFTLLYLVTVLSVVAADSFVLAAALAEAVPAVPPFLWITLFLTLALWANLRGIRTAGGLQDGTTLLLIGSVAAISVGALLRLGLPAHPGGLLPAGGFLNGVTVGVFIYMGFEWVTPLAEEVTNHRLMAPGMYIAIGLLAITFGLYTLAETSLPHGPHLQGSLYPQLLLGRDAFGPLGFWWMLAVTLFTAVATFNGAFVSASRLLYALARERSLPTPLARLNRHLVPQSALYLLYTLSLALALAVDMSGRYRFLINMGAALEAAMYAVAGAALWRLEKRRETPRLWLPALTVLLYAPLAAAALLLPSDLPLPAVPWDLLILAGLALAAITYVRAVVPRLRARPRSAPGGRS